MPISPPSIFWNAATVSKRLPSLMRFVFGIALLGAMWGGLFAAQQNSAAPKPVYRTIQSLLDLPPTEQNKPQKVEFEGNIVYRDDEWHMLWIEIENSPHYAYLPDGANLNVSAGQHIRIQGSLAIAQGLQLKDLSITPLGKSTAYALVDFEKLEASPPPTAQLTQIEALVSRQRTEDFSHVFLELSFHGKTVAGRLKIDPRAPIPQYTGAQVRAKAIYNPQRDLSHGVLTYELLIAGVDSIEVLGWLDKDPSFDKTVIGIANLGKVREGDRAHVTGILRALTPGQSAVIRDQTGQLEVFSGQTALIELGSTVEAVGIPEWKGSGWTLRDAVYRASKNTYSPSSTKLSQLRMTDQVRTLSIDNAGLGYPVSLVGVVTWVHPATNTLYLQDVTGGIRVVCPPGITPPQRSAIVSIEGHTVLGSFAPEVRAEAINTVTPTSPQNLTAQLITLEHAFTGAEEGQRVAIQGYLRSVTEDKPWYRLEVSTPGGGFFALAPAEPGIRQLVGSIVQLKGICTAVANKRRQITGIQILVASPEDIQVEEAVSSDLGSVPLRTISSLSQYSTFNSTNRRVRVAGTVIHVVPDRTLFIQEGVDGLEVQCRDTKTLTVGDRVEAVGFAGNQRHRPILREALVRRISSGEDPAPVRMDLSQPLDQTLDGRLVRIAPARLVQITAGMDGTHLLLQSQSTIFAAVLSTRDEQSSPWKAQSMIDLKGVCRISYDERGDPTGVTIELRTPSDVIVLEQPTWWTPERAFAVAAILSSFLVGGLAWVALLRKRVRDQTEHIRLQLIKEADLRARHRDILENASDCIFTTDQENRISTFNPAGETLLGFGIQEVRGMPIRDLFADAEECAEALRQLDSGLATGSTLQTRFRKKDGNPVWVEISARRIFEEGRATGILAIVRDISERKRVEEQIQNARIAAEDSAKAKSAFLASMSHEIRTPMNGVIGMTNILLDTPLNAEQRDFADTIRNSAEALLTVLNDILDFSKIEAGKLNLELLPFDLHEAVEGAMSILAARASDKNLEMIVEISPDVPKHLSGDPGRLRQILLNLIGNAIKFTAAGEVMVRVLLEQQKGNTALLKFEIKDTGIGITQEAQSRLFSAFAQADASTTRRYGGTGLGLAISKQLSELMDGSIGLTSEPGKGSTFWFTAKFIIRDRSEDQESLSFQSLAGKKVLIVDDNATNRRIIQHYLSDWGMVCQECDSADAAMQISRAAAAKGDYFDITLLDYHMPDVDGLQLATMQKEAGLVEHTHTLLLSSIDKRFPEDRLSAAGVHGVMTKPIRQTDLLKALARLIGTRQESEEKPLPVAEARSTVATEKAPQALIAEDNIVNQRVARLLLERMGFKVDTADNGLEALKALEAVQYDVIFMDCHMPELDGYETTRRIRAENRYPGIKIIAMTALAMEGDRDKCIEAGMDDYVSKPVRIAELKATLERLNLAQVIKPKTATGEKASQES